MGLVSTFRKSKMDKGPLPKISLLRCKLVKRYKHRFARRFAPASIVTLTSQAYFRRIHQKHPHMTILISAHQLHYTNRLIFGKGPLLILFYTVFIGLTALGAY